MKKKLVAIAAAAVAMIPLIGSPAHASASGKVAFQCTTTLPEFPSPQASATCSGSATGKVAGQSVGGDAYVVVAAGVNNFKAEFEYNEACLAEGVPPALGTANGTATVTGLVGVKAGPGGAKVPVTGSATLGFTWTRVGVNAVVTVSSDPSKTHLDFSDGDTATLTVAAATATFAPVLTLANTCPVGGPLTAAVAGTATFGA